MSSPLPYSPGLAGVVAAETALSRVDGLRGQLHYRGRPLAQATAEGFGPCAAWLLDQPVALGQARSAAHLRQVSLKGLPADPMAQLRARVASSSAQGLALVAELGVAFTHCAAAQRGAVPLAPDPRAEHAHDLLRCALGEPPSPAQAQAFSRYLATVMDHGLNASTFTARVVASTGSDDCSAVVAAIGALKGPLHGGAPGPVLDMLDAVAEQDIPAWLQAELDAGRRIMGMGHRVYRVRDPRAQALEDAMVGLDSPRLRLARTLEAHALVILASRHPDRKLAANVEFYTALLLESVGLHRSLFTPAFACGRVVGWLAHVREQRATGTILRPASRYIGPPCEV